MKKIKYILIAVIVILVVGLMAWPSKIHYQKEDVVPPQKDELDLYIDRLANEFECVNCPENFRHLDNNNEYSYSCLQFQEQTFIWKVKDYNLLPAAEDGEILNLIYDCDFQKKLARLMFENEPDAWKHWRTSVEKRGLGYPPTVYN